MSSAVQDPPSSAGLASRPSFFGGFVSTRKASALPTWQPAKPSDSLAQNRSGQTDKLKASAGTKGRPSTQIKSAPAPPLDPVVLRKQQLKANRNFDSDSDTEAEKSKPRAYNQHLAQLEQKLSAAEKAAAAKRPALKPQHVKQQLQQQQQQQQQQSAYKSPYNQAPTKGSAQTQTIAPKGKARAASRSMALAPQTISLSRKQMADRGMRKAVEAVRGQGSSPLPQHPAVHAQPNSSNSRLGSTANRGPSSMPSTSGRPTQPSGAPPGRPTHPSGAPPGRMPASHHPNRQTIIARSTALDASRRPTQGMPAWMQKAKQAVSCPPKPPARIVSLPGANGAAAAVQSVQSSTAYKPAQATLDVVPAPVDMIAHSPECTWRNSKSRYKAVLAGRGPKRMRHEEDEYDNDDFVVDDEEEPDWRQALKSVTRYDPSKFDDTGFDDRSMEASYKQIQAEERRSARMGREDDLRAEEEELRMQEEKRKKRKRAKGSNGLVM